MKRKKNSIIHSIRKQDGKAQKRDYRKKERKKERSQRKFRRLIITVKN